MAQQTRIEKKKERKKGAGITPAEAAFCTQHVVQSGEFDCEPAITIP